MKNRLMTAAGMALLFAGMGGLLLAYTIPEIDGASASSALALLGGAVLLIRGQKR
jgi:hypothetical protein